MSSLTLPIRFEKNVNITKRNVNTNTGNTISYLFTSRFLPLLRLDGIRRISALDRKIIGNREVVGYGLNGNPEYFDKTDYPFPAIRWKETSPELCALKQKERGDWKNLSLCEKKELYRWNFRHTFAEVLVPTGNWKCTLGCALMLMNFGATFWFIFYHKLLYRLNPLPDSFSDEKRSFQFRRLLDIENNPIFGITTWWDYEKDDWKDSHRPK